VGQEGKRYLVIIALFLFDSLIEIAFLAGYLFCGIGTLRFSSTQCPGYNPAGPAGIGTFVNTVQSLFNCSRALLTIITLFLAQAPPTLFEFPAI